MIEPGMQPVRTDFSDRADCVDVAAFDIIGERYDLRRVCFDDELSPTVISDAGVVNLPNAGVINLPDASNGEESSDRETSVKDSGLDGADGGGTPKARVDARAPLLSDAGNASNNRDAEGGRTARRSAYVTTTARLGRLLGDVVFAAPCFTLALVRVLGWALVPFGFIAADRLLRSGQRERRTPHSDVR